MAVSNRTANATPAQNRNIPTRITTLDSVVDPGTIGAQYVPVRDARKSFRYPGFGRDPDLQPPVSPTVTTSSSLQEQPTVSSTLAAMRPGSLVDDGIAGDGNVGANSPSEGPDANGPNGIGSMSMQDVANVAMGMLGMVPGPIGIVASIANQIANPNSIMNSILGPDEPTVTQSVTQAANPGSVQSPGDEGIADGMNAPSGPTGGDASDTGAAGTSDSADGDGGAASSGDAAAAAAAADAANASDATGGAAWEEGGIIPGMEEDGFSDPVPNQTMHEGEGVIPVPIMEEIGDDWFEELMQLPTLDMAGRQQLVAHLADNILSGGEIDLAEDMDEDDMGGGGMMGGGSMAAFQSMAPGFSGGGMGPGGAPQAAIPGSPAAPGGMPPGQQRPARHPLQDVFPT